MIFFLIFDHIEVARVVKNLRLIQSAMEVANIFHLFMEEFLVLVLSRKQNESIQFPDLGITVEILQSGSKTVRVGVQAPVEVKIIRDEIIDDETRRIAEQRVFRIPQELRHELRNELNLISLALHVFKRKVELGATEVSNLSFENLVQRIEGVANHDSLSSPLGTTQIYSEKNQLTTLVVEDSDNERELLGGFLELHGFVVSSVSSGEAAIEFLEDNEAPHAILLDMQLPKIHGSELLKRLRDSPKFDDTFVIVVSGTSAEENNLSIEDGLDAWFEKPIDPKQLVLALQQIPLADSPPPQIQQPQS